jgi:glycosyltransferase involved in cell wall biosynthesis
MRPPIVSVCIPAYNQGRYLREALESALAQSGPDLEVVVYDDASTDGTAELLASVRDPRVRSFRQHKRVGISLNRNSCLAVARGRYLAWLDGDDVYCRDALVIQTTTLERTPRAGLVHGNHHVIGDDGRTLPGWRPPFDQDVVESGGAAFRELTLSNYVTAPTVVVRRECYERVGGYSPALTRCGEDWEMWMRITLHYDLAYSAAPIASYRRHDASSSASATASGEQLLFDIGAIETIFDYRRHQLGLPRDGRLRRRADAALAVKALLQSGRELAVGARRRALGTVLRAFVLAPWLLASRAAWPLATSIALDNEYENYKQTRALLARLHALLAGSRFARSIEKLAVVDPAWERSAEEVAEIVRTHVPNGQQIAVVDKHDPTLLHLCGRSGWHVPDLKLLPGGYPRDGQGAVEHLEALRVQGAGFFVLPDHAFWWLEHYAELRDHLESDCTPVWSDARCRIYQLAQTHVTEAA